MSASRLRDRPLRVTTSPPLTNSCISPRPSFPPRPAKPTPQVLPCNPPSCAGTAGRRWSSSRLSPAHSTSARRPARAFHRECTPLTTLHSSASTASISADAKGLCLAPGTAPSLPRSKTTDAVLAYCRCTRKHDQRWLCRLHRPFTSHREHSNPHSASPSLTLLSTFPRFPPLGLVQRLPSHGPGYGKLSTHGQASDNP